MAKHICSFCVLDDSIPGTVFDASGRCASCISAEKAMEHEWQNTPVGRRKLDDQISKIIATSEGQYDCLIGLSGGLDSAYLAYFLRENYPDLRILALHVDGGWNSEPAVSNIENIVKKLDIDLITHVIEWTEMRDLQRAFLKSGVLNQDIPQDHAFFASLYKTAADRKIKWFLSGVNFSSECVNPTWNYPAIDWAHLKGIHNIFGQEELVTFPHYTLWDLISKKYLTKTLRIFDPLNYINYNRELALVELKQNIEWKDYGEKHSESRWTKFYQDIYLPGKHKFDKRAMHFSSLIVSGQMSRAEALQKLKEPCIDPLHAKHDLKFVARKLKFTENELQKIIQSEPKSHFQYKNNYWIFKLNRTIKNLKNLLS